MGRKCCVPCCKSNYDTETSYTSSFKFPKNQERKDLWIRSINRENFTPSATAVVCIHHFDEKFIIREDRLKRDDGTLLVFQRERPALTSDAYPTIFEQQPSYLTTSLPKPRKSPTKRREETIAKDEENFKKWCINDTIASFEDFSSKCSSKLHSSWCLMIREDFVLCYKICESDCPRIVVGVKLFKDLTVKVWHLDNPMPKKSLEWVLGQEGKCDKWTKFECLLTHLTAYKVSEASFETKLSMIANLMNQCCDSILPNEEDGEHEAKLGFLKEQVMLMTVKQLRYSSKLLMWSCNLYFSYPAAYTLIRNSKILTLPHPYYLKTLSTIFNSVDTNDVNSHIAYLKHKVNLLSKHERIVNVLLDEIYITPSLSYKAGHLVGIANNSNAEATTIQAFMIVSLLSKNKDTVALIPVKNITAETLHTYTLKVLKVLSDCGYIVLCLISDNNRVNRNMFTMMCDGILKPCINNPINPEQKIYFLFDTVHLMKSIRNNWLNQNNQTFSFPNPTNHAEVCAANLVHLKQIYETEKLKIVKQAPRLSQKVLFPTSTERQNVTHALNLFHETNSAALAMNNHDNEKTGTKIFIDYVLQWWKVVNVKHSQKGMHSQDVFCTPITSVQDKNFLFLQEFSIWMNAWNDLHNLKAAEKISLGIAKGGKLSKETHFALSFTTKSLIELIQHIFITYGPSYVLLGKFQTDSLEARFGQYRQMSGGNYHVSYRQVVESEQKLKVLSLISLHSAQMGKFEIKYLEFCDSGIQGNFEIPEKFYDVFNTNDNIEINTHTMSVLIFIAGYVAHKVCHKIKCKTCISSLIQNRNLECERLETEEVFQYLRLIDRGALKWPQAFTVEIIVETFQIFQKLITQKYEEEFLRIGKQKHLIIELALEKFDMLNSNPNDKCRCGMDKTILAKKCISTIANIFLNNYTKVKNDNQTRKNMKRKLTTFKNS